MLKSFFSNFRSYSVFSIGFIFDFTIKKLFEFFIKHLLVYLSLFFAEKFLIELITKKNIEYLIYFLNKLQNFNNFSFSYFFFFTIFFISFISITINLFLIFYS